MRFLEFCCRWSLIAGRLPGRTDNEIKNYWNTHIRRKLLNRGIDPATHRPINEAAQDASTISFAASAVKEEEKSGYGEKDIKRSVQERCPDLNLELTISPPYQNQNEPLKKTGVVSLCFTCSSGLQNGKDCSCRISSIGSSSSTGSSAPGYDFLGMKSAVLDYRSLETK
ncbi:hypothetical protein I3842_06G122900 [Carya illinoinensis]|uniref:Uncharacterized protein n=1 Tax=Carya illinoinensis TaxID=32201 RepID=A0A922EW44_CARIL|nr:hypothetical protein I3842_06G122900 [Carya illinoinensis]